MKLTTENDRDVRPTDQLILVPFGLLGKVAAGLALLTFLIYLPVIGYTFVNYDDEIFTINNVNLAPGITWSGIKWAFTSTEIDYWRPLSWLSHMLDIELFGAVGGLHHLTNLLIHIAATVMLLMALHRLTKTVWPSAVVAALFAWHPLHVESVAWIAERKDVLCGFFWFFTIWAHARYVETPSSGRYALVLLGFIFGVMSKPMIVTAPCVLLLLDFWPLRRINVSNLANWKGNPNWQVELKVAWNLLKEKLPLFAIVLALSLSTISAQREVGTMSEDMPLFVKVVNVCQSYLTYVRQTFWPTGLCILYPLLPEQVSWKWAAAVSLCVALTIRFLLSGLRFPFLAVGWLWYLGVLVPMIGIIQVGEQAHADRYTYVPLVGLFLMLVWGAMAVAEERPTLKSSLPIVTTVVLLACAVVTRRQLPYWENSVELFKRAIEVNPENLTAYNNVASELMQIGRIDEAIPYLEAGLSRNSPQTITSQRRPGMVWNLGLCYWTKGDLPRAQSLILEAMSKEPNRRVAAEWLTLLRSKKPLEDQQVWKQKLIALILANMKDYAGATIELTEAIRLNPQDIGARVDKAAYLAVTGKDEEAVILLRETVQLSPTNVLALSNLGGLLAKKGRVEEAIVHYRTALKLAPSNPDTRHNFALVLARNNRPLEARAEFEEVLRQSPEHQPAIQQLGWLLATRPECQDAPRALMLARSAVTKKVSATTLDLAAAATAANHNFENACQLAMQAIQKAREAKLVELEEAIRARLALYRSGQPYLQPVSTTPRIPQ